MQLSPEEAHAALATVQEVQEDTHRTVSWGASYEVVWGMVWVVGFLASQFVPTGFGSAATLGWVWGVLSCVGGGLSACLGISFSRQQPMRRTSGNWLESPEARVGFFFCALILYSSVLFALFVPLWLNGPTSARQYGEQLSVWWVVTFMFGYVVIGLWFHLGQLVGLGVAVTASALLGYYALPDYFYLIMALIGGGALIVHGLVWLRPWRR